jgi:DNA-binding MarR family transcriptional regulator
VSENQQFLSAIAKTVFHLNGQLLGLGEGFARPVGLTAAWWLVLGAVFEEPKPVAQVAREIGVTRQSVQRIADVLVDRGLASYQPNPRHRRAKLLGPTQEGIEAVRRISPAHAEFADRLAAELGSDQIRAVVATLSELSVTLDRLARGSDADIDWVVSDRDPEHARRDAPDPQPGGTILSDPFGSG